ncbi:hypothetical protein ACFRJ1_33060 [Streptomyces sp. NPDC056773]|uniref:hypothetical protein n=1 Tax=unclassified Streptomyces TaxID=2593676 RepID=UPI0036CEADAA
MEFFIGALTTVLGILVGGGMTWFSTSRHDRLVRVFDMHRELHGTELLAARYRAGAAVRRHQGSTYLELEQELGPQTAHDLRLVVHFFERLWLAIEHDTIPHRYVPRLFGDTFYWWYAASFRHQFIPLASEVGLNIQKLWEWLERHASPEQRERWHLGNERWLPAQPPPPQPVDPDAGRPSPPAT